MNDLFADAIEAFRAGRGLPSTPPAVDAPPSDQYVLDRMSAGDRLGLARLAQPRESALALARAGRAEEARVSMNLADFLQSVSPLSADGRAYVLTLHHAAESYLSFRAGNHGEARARMVAAMEATDQLADAWGDSEFIARRRVHLGHNLMRVDVASGALRDGMDLGANLLECLAGLPAAPGTPCFTWRAPDDVAGLYFDLIAQTAAEALSAASARDAAHLLSLTARLRTADVKPWRGWNWLTVIKRHAVEGNTRGFLAAAEPFLRAGRGETPTLWYATALDLARRYRALDPMTAGSELDEIVVELETAPRVPSCMRPSRWRQAA